MCSVSVSYLVFGSFRTMERLIEQLKKGEFLDIRDLRRLCGTVYFLFIFLGTYSNDWFLGQRNLVWREQRPIYFFSSHSMSPLAKELVFLLFRFVVIFTVNSVIYCVYLNVEAMFPKQTISLWYNSFSWCWFSELGWLCRSWLLLRRDIWVTAVPEGLVCFLRVRVMLF